MPPAREPLNHPTRRAWLQGVAWCWAWGCVGPARAEALPPGLSLAQALARPDHVLLMRHADAPGVGDPAGYRLDDCSTQRNLDAGGRRQAERIGHWLRAQGLPQAVLYSSAWCRCLDTARGLAMGAVQVEPSLNSFFDRPGQAAAQNRALKAFLARTLPAKGSRPLILVTHHVNILELVGENIAPGDMVLVSLGAAGEVSGYRRYPSPV